MFGDGKVGDSLRYFFLVWGSKRSCKYWYMIKRERRRTGIDVFHRTKEVLTFSVGLFEPHIMRK